MTLARPFARAGWLLLLSGCASRPPPSEAAIEELRVAYSWTGHASSRPLYAVLVPEGEALRDRVGDRLLASGTPAALAAALAADLVPVERPWGCLGHTDDHPHFRIEARLAGGRRRLLFSDSNCPGARPWNVLEDGALWRQDSDRIPAALMPLLVELGLQDVSGWSRPPFSPPRHPYEDRSLDPGYERGPLEFATFAGGGTGADAALGGRAVIVGTTRSLVPVPIDLLAAALTIPGTPTECIATGSGGYRVRDGRPEVDPALAVAPGQRCGFVCLLPGPATAERWAGTLRLSFRATGTVGEIEDAVEVAGTFPPAAGAEAGR